MKATKLKYSDVKEKNITQIRDSISSLGGVNAVRVDDVSNTITVDYDEQLVSESDIRSKLGLLK